MQKHRRLLNRLLALVLCFTLCAMAAARAETYACGQAAEKLAAMADDYAGLRAEAILGQWKANAPLTAEAACDMVLRAFGDLPAPEGMQRWLGEQGLMPVSYTHLDVYKRQPLTWPRILPSTFAPASVGEPTSTLSPEPSISTSKLTLLSIS